MLSIPCSLWAPKTNQGNAVHFSIDILGTVLGRKIYYSYFILLSWRIFSRLEQRECQKLKLFPCIIAQIKSRKSDSNCIFLKRLCCKFNMNLQINSQNWTFSLKIVQWPTPLPVMHQNNWNRMCDKFISYTTHYSFWKISNLGKMSVRTEKK